MNNKIEKNPLKENHLEENPLKQQLKQWVMETNGSINSEQLLYDTPILEQRIITSVQITDLILYLEYLRGSPIDVERIGPGVFSTINRIHDTFLHDGDLSCA